MTSHPTVTAIVTCMTDEERPFVEESLRSVIDQTMPCAIRLYVRDDNDWIDGLVADLSGLTLRRLPAMNSAQVRNLGVEEADGKYVAFLDSDDVWFPAKTERQVAAAEALGVPFVGADHVMITEGGKRFAYGAAKYLPMTSSWLVARHYMKRFHFNERLYRHEDKEWWHGRRHDAPRYRLPEFLISYRVRPSSKSAQGDGTLRKLQLRRLSAKPGLGLPILGASWIYSRINRRNFYVRHPNVRTSQGWNGATYGGLEEMALKRPKP